MGLRRRLFVYSLPLVLLVIAAVWGLSQTILIKRFDQLDAQQLEVSHPAASWLAAGNAASGLAQPRLGLVG